MSEALSLMTPELQLQQLQALQQQMAAADPTQATAPTAEAAAADPNQLAALSALGVMPQMAMPSLTGGLTGLTGVAGVGTDPMAASLGALGPQYAAAAQAAAANATALYYQALLGLSPGALGLATTAETPAPTGRTFNTKPGDWNCKACGDLQFARNTKCRRCGAPKPSQEELDAAPPAQVKMAPNGRPMRPGDWLCPNCGDHNFARNPQCRKCGTPKPVTVDMLGGAGAGDVGGKGHARSPHGSDLRPGDWICPKCHDHVFARNEHCRRCGQSRPTGADLAAMAAAGTLPPANPARARERSRSRG
eukprot:symbB.v1.2.001058.t2/scaffold33.1/size517934/10